MEKSPQEGSAEVTGSGQERLIPTAESLQQEMVALRAKVEAAKLQKAADVEKKVTERQSLIGEAKSNVELLNQATQTLDYFTTMQELGSLDEADLQKLEELKALVGSLEQKRDEINARIDIISNTPEVLDKVQDAAGKENADRERKELIENFHKEFDPRIQKLIEERKVVEQRYVPALNDRTHKKNELDDLNNKVRDAVNNAVGKVMQNPSRSSDLATFVGTIEVVWRRSDTAANFYDQIKAMKDELGFFDGKKKAVIDSLLTKIEPLVPQSSRIEKEYEGFDSAVKQVEAEREASIKSLQNLLDKTRTVDDRFKELNGKPSDGYNNLGWDLYHKYTSAFYDRSARIEEVRQSLFRKTEAKSS